MPPGAEGLWVVAGVEGQLQGGGGVVEEDGWGGEGGGVEGGVEGGGVVGCFSVRSVVQGLEGWERVGMLACLCVVTLIVSREWVEVGLWLAPIIARPLPCRAVSSLITTSFDLHVRPTTKKLVPERNALQQFQHQTKEYSHRPRPYQYRALWNLPTPTPEIVN